MLAFANALARITTDYDVQPSERATFQALIVGRIVAYRLQLPTSPVESAIAFYTETLADLAASQISQINESVVIPVDLVLEQIKRIWLARYRLVYVPMSEEAADLATQILCASASLNAPEVNELLGRWNERRSVMYAIRELNEVYAG